MTHLLTFIIKLYQRTLSFDHGLMHKLFPNTHYCRYYPTCSEYAVEAIEKYGSAKGGLMATKRVLRCHPWSKHERIDPVP